MHHKNASKSLVKSVLRHMAALAAMMAVVATAHGQTTKIHGGGILDLVSRTDIGTITQPLLTATIASTGQDIFFVITDANNKDYAEMFGAVRVDSLEEAPDAAVETAVFGEGEWAFYNDPGLVARYDASGNALLPVADPDYSPLKRIEWDGEIVTMNAPFIN